MTVGLNGGERDRDWERREYENCYPVLAYKVAEVVCTGGVEQIFPLHHHPFFWGWKAVGPSSVCPTKLCILLGRANSGAIIISKVRLGPCKKTSEKGEKANEMGECDIYIYSRVNKGWWEWSRLPSMHLFRARAIALSSGGLCLPGASVFRGLNF